MRITPIRQFRKRRQLVSTAGLMEYVVGFSDRFEVDKNDPRIEVKIIEI